MKLEDISRDEQAKLPYETLCQLRVEAWGRRLKGMPVPTPLKRWAAAMADKHGPKVKVWANELDWITALMVVRYGEDHKKWPKKFSAQDAIRAERWLVGKDIPPGITHYIESRR